MSSDSCVFLLVLPELTFLILINFSLIFALLFSYSESNQLPGFGSNKLAAISSKFDSAYHGFVVTPLLQADAVAKLSLLTFLHVALIYLNSHQVWTSGFGLIGDDLGRFYERFFYVLCASCALGLSLQSLKRFSRYEFILLMSLSLLGMLCLIKSASFLSFLFKHRITKFKFFTCWQLCVAVRNRAQKRV